MKSVSISESLRGLTSREAELSRKSHGANILTPQKQKSFIRHFFENMKDPVIKILLCALCVNLLFVFKDGDIAETIGIAISVFLATFISTLSERGSEAAFKRLNEECSKAVYRVRRDGEIKSISIEDIVVGDIIMLEAGEQIPADARILTGTLTVDQSAMTGESREIEKKAGRDKDRTPHSKSAVFRGCLVLSGVAEAQVFAVGSSTMLGQISGEVSAETRESPLKVRLTKLAKQISTLGYVAAFLVAAAYLFNTLIIDSGCVGEIIMMKLSDVYYLGEHLLHAFMLGLTVIVVAVPEGLPMMIAVVLSANIKRMINDRVLVRKPVGIEAAGSMDLLFTDKTGTLTEGKMSVGAIITADGTEAEGYDKLNVKCPRIAEFYRLSCLCNTTSVIDGGKAIGGNFTERALLESISSSKHTKNPPSVKARIPFDSDKKYSAVSIDSTNTVLIKGAPEKLIRYAKYAYGTDGNILPFADLSYSFLKRIDATVLLFILTLLTILSLKLNFLITSKNKAALSEQPF
jgi:magnesium-transporting ATPase (P-type)